MSKTKKELQNNFLKNAIRDAELLKEAAVATARVMIGNDLNSKVKEMIDEQIVQEEGEEDEENPSRIIPDEEEASGEEAGGIEAFAGEETPEEEAAEAETGGLPGEEEEVEEALMGEEDEELPIDIEDDEEEGEEEMEEALDDMNPAEEIPVGEEEEEDEEMPPTKLEANQSLRETVRKLQRENKNLRIVVRKQSQAIQETNLFNAKTIYASKLNSTFPLNRDQKKKIYERFDKATDMNQVKLVYNTLRESLSILNKTNSNAKRKSNPLKENISRTIKKTNAKPLNEDAEVLQKKRLQKLAGIQAILNS